MERGTPTRYPGVLKIDDKTYVIRAKATCPRTGKTKEVAKRLDGVSLLEAAQTRAELVDGIKNPVEQSKKVRVGEFARSWIASKLLRVDATTARTYVDALEGHILPALGDYFYDALTSQDVQRWIDDAIRNGYVIEVRNDEGELVKERRAYSRNSIAVWFRIFRTMTRDAMDALNLQRDPTLRVALPEAPLDDGREPNALSPEQLAEFLTAMRTHYPQHYALVVLLAYTGLRWCHASALRWEDFDEEAGIIRVERKQVRGKVGPVSRKKRAPKEYPVEPELAEILKWHRQRLLKEQAPGLAAGWMFPSSTGTPRTPNSLDRAWVRCLKEAEIKHRFTVHGLRYTFTDLVRRANVDAVVRRALTGHVTEEMQRHYSTVGLDEKRAAIAGVIRLVPPTERRQSPVCDGSGGTNGGTNEPGKATA